MKSRVTLHVAHDGEFGSPHFMTQIMKRRKHG